MTVTFDFKNMVIDLESLRNQKENLIMIADSFRKTSDEESEDALNGVIDILEAIQDYIVDNNIASEEKVFGLPELEVEELNDSFLEVYCEMCQQWAFRYRDGNPVIEKLNEVGGTDLMYSICKKMAIDFYNQYRNRKWDGDFFEEVEYFFTTEIKQW